MQSENIIAAIFDFEKSPFQFFDFEKLPKEILPLILGQLSFADLIVAKNVCRRFNRLFKVPIIDRMFDELYDKVYVETSFEIDELDFGEIDTYLKLAQTQNYIWNVRQIVDKIINFADGSREECVWLFLMGRIDFVHKFGLLPEIIGRVLNTKMADSTKVYYFRKYYESPYSKCNITKDNKVMRRCRIMEILMKHEWQEDNLRIFENIIRIVLNDEKDRDNLAGLFRRLYLPEGYYTTAKYQRNRHYLALIDKLAGEYLAKIKN